jgi:hypothetical protein
MYKCGQKENTNYTFGVKESSKIKEARRSACTCSKCGETYSSFVGYCSKCGEKIMNEDYFSTS